MELDRLEELEELKRRAGLIPQVQTPQPAVATPAIPVAKDSRAASNYYDEIRERYGITPKGQEAKGSGRLDDPDAGKPGFNLGLGDDRTKTIQRLIENGSIGYDPGSGKFDLSFNDRRILGIDDADIGRALLIQRQRERAKELEQTFPGMTPAQLGFNTATPRAQVLALTEKESGLRAGTAARAEAGVTGEELAELGLDPKKRYSQTFLQPYIDKITRARAADLAETTNEQSIARIEATGKENEDVAQVQNDGALAVQRESNIGALDVQRQADSTQTTLTNSTNEQNFNLAQQQMRDSKEQFLLQLAEAQRQRSADTKLSMQQFQLQMDQMDRRDAREERRDEKERRSELMVLLMRGLGQLGAGFSSI